MLGTLLVGFIGFMFFVSACVLLKAAATDTGEEVEESKQEFALFIMLTLLVAGAAFFISAALG